MRFFDPRLAQQLESDIQRALRAFPPLWCPASCRYTHYLTNTEIRVLKRVGVGMSNKEIAESMFISPLTVRTHVKRLHDKCEIPGRARLAVAAFTILDRGLWVEPEEKRRAILAEARA